MSPYESGYISEVSSVGVLQYVRDSCTIPVFTSIAQEVGHRRFNVNKLNKTRKQLNNHISLAACKDEKIHDAEYQCIMYLSVLGYQYLITRVKLAQCH